ncbi:MAG: valine--tRNA ligase [Rickettsiales bacterium]|nr:valine--tRNA ligase [Rickettsiales bacterium]
MKELPKKYNAKEIEKKWQQIWQEKKIYSWKNDLPKEQTFVIDTPPPTVSGILHMGHVFSYCQADFVARYQRMSGKDVFYPMGFDDNGLPTERLVEKVIKKKAGIYESENGKGSFVKKCREVVEEAEQEFENLFNSIALSVDWEQKYQSISPESQKISQASFIDLFNKGLVEKKSEPVFWDVSDRTALAQADLEDKEKDGAMHYIDFTVEDDLGEDEYKSGSPLFKGGRADALAQREGLHNKIQIMTTRPELLGACVAVMVNPEDEKYKNLHGKNAITPVFGEKVKIIADDSVQIDKGTGAVMCCTFGDETDIKWWRKHNLDLKIVIGRDGKIEELPLKQYREKVLKDLENAGVLQKVEPIKHSVKCAERSGCPIEILVEDQWFIKILDKKEELKKIANEANWYPTFMKVRIEQWIDGLAWDWCISRQRFFGVKFPVWYSLRKGEEGKIIVADIEQLPCDPEADLPKGYSREEVQFETDIMDTWATSSISPQLSSKGISSDITFDKGRHEKLFPADLRPQAHEIIRTWAFYTIVKSMLHEGRAPWKNLMISGWCLASDKTKMSKSKGNVVTPTTLIEEKGSDIVRYWASTSHLGADTAYSEDVLKIGAKLVTKLFNASKFASMNFDLLDEKITSPSEASDKWILSRLQQVIKEATAQFEKFEYAKAREKIEEFFWNDFCDNYLEICKVRTYGLKAQKLEGKELSEIAKEEIVKKQQSAIFTLKYCLNNLLKLFAPFIPHICDEIYSSLFESEFEEKGSISARGNWPKYDENLFDESLVKKGEEALKIIAEVRKYKSDNNLSMKAEIDEIKLSKEIEGFAEDLENVCSAKKVLY